MAEDLRALVLQAPVSDHVAGPESGIGPEVVTESRALVSNVQGMSYSLYGFIPLSAPQGLDLDHLMTCSART